MTFSNKVKLITLVIKTITLANSAGIIYAAIILFFHFAMISNITHKFTSVYSIFIILFTFFGIILYLPILIWYLIRIKLWQMFLLIFFNMFILFTFLYIIQNKFLEDIVLEEIVILLSLLISIFLIIFIRLTLTKTKTCSHSNNNET
ncbi:hypothetical protein F1631_02000 [Leptospira interrogans serovar Yeoncheon]|nr:hypothetical protein [Leptospira interrogans serovar Yeoncheon]MBE0302027.1 hypothetical protein [Leptospira interrogans serovar Yeoncheon]OQM33836.1 hypothetical protein DV38_00355 [Leptospira interrogans]